MIKLFLVVLICAIQLPNKIFAQKAYAIAISKNGILTGKQKIISDTENSSTVNTIPDSITIQEAQSIFALNAMYNDKKTGPTKIEIFEFQMTITYNNDTTRLICKSELLSERLTNELKKIRQGSNLYFEGIKCVFSNGDTQGLTLLAFYIE